MQIENDSLNLLRWRFSEAKLERQNILVLYKKAYENFTVEGLSLKEIDSTGVKYASKLANKLSSYIMNSNYIWAYIETPRYEDIPREDKMQFDYITEVVFDHIQKESNFELEKIKLLRDYLIGTTAFKVRYTGQIRNPVLIEHCPILNIYLAKNRAGRTGDVFYKRDKVKKHELIDMLGYSILEDEFVQALTEQDEFSLTEATVWDYKKKCFLYAITIDDNFDKVIYYQETDYNPWIVARFEAMSDSPYGIGPCTKAVLTLEELQKIKKRIAKIGEHQASPSYAAYTSEPKYIAQSRLNTPGKISILGVSKNQTVLEPFNRGENADIKFFEMEEYKSTLNDIFYISLIENIGSVDQLKNVTATTTQVLVTELAKQIEPTYSLMQKEMLEPIVMKTFYCLTKANYFDLTQISVLKNDPRVKIRFYNALTIAQEQDDQERANMYFQTIASVLGGMVAANNINASKFIDATQKRFRVKAAEFKSGEETEKQTEQTINQMSQEQGDIAMQAQVENKGVIGQ